MPHLLPTVFQKYAQTPLDRHKYVLTVQALERQQTQPSLYVAVGVLVHHTSLSSHVLGPGTVAVTTQRQAPVTYSSYSGIKIYNKLGKYIVVSISYKIVKYFKWAL